MKKIIISVYVLVTSCINVHADFMYSEIDPICSISGTTHTSFPGEISDTSSWYIPTAYEGECLETPNLTNAQKDRIFEIMHKFFVAQDFTGSLYSSKVDSSSMRLNIQGQDFVNENLFPALQIYISKEVQKTKPNTQKIAILNYAVSTIGYDYYLRR